MQEYVSYVVAEKKEKKLRLLPSGFQNKILIRMNEFARNTKKKHEKNKGKKHWQGVSWGELEGK